MLLGFKKQFAPKILDGSKKFTIRNRRKVEPKIGDTLHMYTGLRTKQTERITSAHKLTGIQLVDIEIKKVGGGIYSTKITVDGKILDVGLMDFFAKCDGFNDLESFRDYWINQLGEKTKHFQQGIKEPITTRSNLVNVKDLIIYHWTDLRF